MSCKGNGRSWSHPWSSCGECSSSAACGGPESSWWMWTRACPRSSFKWWLKILPQPRNWVCLDGGVGDNNIFLLLLSLFLGHAAVVGQCLDIVAVIFQVARSKAWGICYGRVTLTGEESFLKKWRCCVENELCYWGRTGDSHWQWVGNSGWDAADRILATTGFQADARQCGDGWGWLFQCPEADVERMSLAFWCTSCFPCDRST